MGVNAGRSLSARMSGNVVIRVAAFYLLLAIIVTALWALLQGRPDAVSRVVREALLGGGEAIAARGGGDAPLFSAVEPVPLGSFALDAIIAMGCAALLALPVAWVYTLTRQKRGYQQSVVQTLVLLPTVVGGVVVLVRHSLALAFSLAGIVAAVRFRNTLDDSKDAVYIFLATGLGLAAGVEPTAAFVLSVGFNLLVLALWRADFGRTPARLEGREAERRLERAMAIANRTTQFVARLDKEVLGAMAPEQLDALADRAWRRRRRQAPDLPARIPRREALHLLRVRASDVDAARGALEPALAQQVKRWRYGGVVTDADGTQTVEYTVQLRKGVTRDAVVAALREHGAPFVADIQLL